MSKDLTVAIRDYAALDRSIRAYHAASRQPRTWVSYNLAWQRFSNFCSPKDVWKATPEDVARWCVWQAGQGLSVSTISGNLSGLKFYYEELGKGHSRGRSGVARWLGSRGPPVTGGPNRSTFSRPFPKGSLGSPATGRSCS